MSHASPQNSGRSVVQVVIRQYGRQLMHGTLEIDDQTPAGVSGVQSLCNRIMGDASHRYGYDAVTLRVERVANVQFDAATLDTEQEIDKSIPTSETVTEEERSVIRKKRAVKKTAKSAAEKPTKSAAEKKDKSAAEKKAKKKGKQAPSLNLQD